jgi:PAS domain S-box-containing protein
MMEAPILTFLVILLAVSTAVLVLYAARLRNQTGLIDDLPDGVLTVDRGGRITRSNSAVHAILGESRQDVVGRSVIELLPMVEPLLLDVPTEEPERIEVVLGEGDGAKTYDVKVAVCQNEHGENTGWLVMLHDITRPKQVGEDLLRQKERFEWLLSVARATTEQLTIEETLQNILDVTATLTSAEFGSLLLLDEKGVVTRGILALGKPIPGQEQLMRRVLDRGLAGWVFRNKETALVDDTFKDERWLPSDGNGYQARSALAVPIISQQMVVAVLNLTHSSPFHFQQEDADLIETAGEQMALAVRNAQLYDEQRVLAGRQTTLYEVLRTVGGNLDPDEVTRKATEIITQLTGWPAVAILTPDGHETELVVKAATGFLSEWVSRKVSTQNEVTGHAFHLGECRYWAEVSGEGSDGEWPPAGPPRVASQLAVPLRRGENVLGVLEVHSQDPHAMTEQDIRLATSLAEATALALDNARYHGAMRKHAADLNALYTVNRMIGRSLELEEMLSKSLYSALTSLGFGFGLIGLVNPATEKLTLASQRSVPVELLAQYENGNLEETFAGFVYHQNRGVVIDDLERESPELGQLRQIMPDFVSLLKQLNVRALVGVPLDHQRRSLGVLCMFSRKAHQYTSNDMALQVTIGQQIGMAVSHSRLFSAVSEERSLLQALIDSSRDGIVMVGPNGKVLVVNQTALDFLQIPGQSDDWISRPIMTALLLLRKWSPKLVRMFINEVRRDAGENNRSSSGEFEFSSRSIRWQNLPVWSGSTFLGRLVVFNDRTDERELNQVREDLVHTMVHDLRNPLTNIFGSLEFLGEEVGPTLSPDYQQVLEIARTNATHMVDLVGAILELNRLESGQMPLDQKPIFLPTLIGNVVRTQSPLAKNKNIVLNFETANDLPLAWADGNLFERVLQNLLDNAIRFTPPGGRVQVQARLESSRSDWLLVSVSDSGPGVPDEVRERIFQKFTTARHRESGTGLGLAFCKMVVEAHGGRIWIESDGEQGSVFYFTLPPLPATDKGKKGGSQ